MRWRASVVIAAAWITAVSCTGGSQVPRDGDANGQPPHVEWSVLADAADGLAANDRTVVVVGGEWVLAYEARDGVLRWEGEVGDSNSSRTPVAIRDGVVVVGEETLQAFDEESGEPIPVPSGFDLAHQTTDMWGLAASNLVFEDGGIRDGDRVLWREDGDEPPSVGRLGDFIVINDFDRGLHVLDSSGTTVLSEPIGPAMYDQSMVVTVSEPAAYTITADGRLWKIAH